MRLLRLTSLAIGALASAIVSGAHSRESVPRPTGLQASRIRLDLTTPPPANEPGARLAWATKETARLRKALADRPRTLRPGALLGALAVVAAYDIERAISIGDLASAAGMRDLLEEQITDAPWRLNWLAEHRAGGAYFALGVLTFHGVMVQPDPDLACRLFESAWGAGFDPAAYRLSNCVAQSDASRALRLLEVAAEAGHPAANEVLGRRCLEASPPDLACASSRIGLSASAGRPSAKSLLGWMTAQGLGMPADTARALRLYGEAANAGDLPALNNLGEIHETGRSVPADAAKAAGFYRQAAEAGFAPAQFNLGRMYAAGTGVPRDTTKAREWLGAALKAGIQPAQKVLDWLDSPAGQARR